MIDKQSRAEMIVAAILELDAQHGGPLPLGKTVARIVRLEDWEARIKPGYRWSVAPSYRSNIFRREIEDPNFRTLELKVKGKAVFVVNLHDGGVEIHLFRPGAWEKRFDSDPGNDVVPHNPGDPPVGPTAGAQAVQRNEDLQLPPQRPGPKAGEDLRNPTMRQGRRAGLRRTDGPYTVALSQKVVPGF